MLLSYFTMKATFNSHDKITLTISICNYKLPPFRKIHFSFICLRNVEVVFELSQKAKKQSESFFSKSANIDFSKFLKINLILLFDYCRCFGYNKNSCGTQTFHQRVCYAESTHESTQFAI